MARFGSLRCSSRPILQIPVGAIIYQGGLRKRRSMALKCDSKRRDRRFLPSLEGNQVAPSMNTASTLWRFGVWYETTCPINRYCHPRLAVPQANPTHAPRSDPRSRRGAILGRRTFTGTRANCWRWKRMPKRPPTLGSTFIISWVVSPRFGASNSSLSCPISG